MLQPQPSSAQGGWQGIQTDRTLYAKHTAITDKRLPAYSRPPSIWYILGTKRMLQTSNVRMQQLQTSLCAKQDGAPIDKRSRTGTMRVQNRKRTRQERWNKEETIETSNCRCWTVVLLLAAHRLTQGRQAMRNKLAELEGPQIRAHQWIIEVDQSGLLRPCIRTMGPKDAHH